MAAKLKTTLHMSGIAEVGYALALVCFTGVAIAQITPASPPSTPAESEAPAPEKPITPPTIAYTGGHLTIEAYDATLADVLTKVAALTGVKIDLPAGASRERMPLVKLGPGPAREVIASLLSDTGFDYVIQDSGTDPEKILNVLVLKREKNGSVTPSPSPSRSRARSAASLAQVEEAPAPVEVSSLNTQPAPTQPDPSSLVPPSSPQPTTPSNEFATPRPGAMTPPVTLTPQTINQQLQQMYLQRVQINQQEHQVAPVVPVSNPGTN
jgi:hypothetical protein